MAKSSLVRNEKDLSPPRGRLINDRMVESGGGGVRDPEYANRDANVNIADKDGIQRPTWRM